MVRPGLCSVLPVPIAPVESPPSRSISRSCRQRVARRRHEQLEVQQCFNAVNWYGGYGGATATADLSPLQHRCVKEVEALVSERVAEERSFSETAQEAAGSLLGSKPSPYEHEGSSIGGLAAYDPGLIPLPDSVHDCPELVFVLCDEA